MSCFSQAAFAVRLEWGAAAIRHLGAEVDCIVVVDVLSFSSCVSLAVERGARVYPYPWRDESALRYGAERGAEVASGKRRFGDGWSLSPQSMLKAHDGLRLVLPSPNGSACAYQARGLGKAVYSASLRNLRATALACGRHARVLVVPCGERWPDDDSLRPSFEDWLVAGGLVALLDRPCADLSPEARAAALAWRGFGAQPDAGLRAALAGCGSALELVERGFEGDVGLCLEEDASDLACRLDGDCFVAERAASER
ncbi:MAG: 2-phosphosulfolactate phosphatase [Burkholderiaceae bacterium]